MSSKLNRCLAAFFFATATCVTASASDLPLVGDASVNSTRTTTTAGTVSNLYVSSANNTFLVFDSTQVPTGTTASQVSKATLLVFVNRVNTAGSVTVSLLSTAFAEGTVTYASQPTIGASQGTFSPTTSSAGQYIAIDVTAAVKGWITTPSSNYGLALTTTAADIVLDSKENDQTAHPARLDVTLSSGSTGTTLSAGTAAGQVYLTGASGAVPTTPVSVSGDATLGSTGVLAIASTAGSDIVTAINAGSSVIGVSKLGTNFGTSTTFLNGSGAFAAPIVLTTTGTSGAATLNGNTLNIPTPAGGGVAITAYFAGLNGGDNTLRYLIPGYVGGANTGAAAAPIAYNELVFVPAACKLSNLNASIFNGTSGGAETINFIVYTNASNFTTATTSPFATTVATAGTASSIACTLSVPTAQNGRGTCSSANSVSLNAGDNFYVSYQESNGGPAPYVQYHVSVTCQ